MSTAKEAKEAMDKRKEKIQ
jgi:hypothetical protein